MSLGLSKSSPQVEATVHQLRDGMIVHLFGDGQDIRIPIEDFTHLVTYVMCNANLTVVDPRIELLEVVRGLTVIEDRFGRRLSGLHPFAQYYSSRL